MTSIDFYTHVADRFEVAAKLIVKAVAQHGRVRVLTGDASMTDALDRRLWVEPPISFLPHCRIDSRLAEQTAVWIDHALEHRGRASVLINLNSAPPPFFSRFERLAEIIGIGDAEAAAGRDRFRFYRERGYELRTHNLSERA